MILRAFCCLNLGTVDDKDERDLNSQHGYSFLRIQVFTVKKALAIMPNFVNPQQYPKCPSTHKPWFR